MVKNNNFIIKFKNFKIYLTPLIWSFVFILLLLLSLPFSSKLEHLFYLQPNLTNIEQKSLQVHFVNVGQGDAILIRFPNNKTMIIDSGPENAKQNLFTYIDNVFFEKDESKIFNYALITHSDIDHSGNMLEILNTYKVETFYRPRIFAGIEKDSIEEPLTSVKIVESAYYNKLINKLLCLQSAGKTNVIFSQVGLIIGDNENTYLTFLTPNTTKYLNTNDYSPMLLVEYNNQKLLLTGDASSSVEIELLNNYNYSLLDVDVLKLGHHGSSTSTSVEFLNVVNPEYVVISVGNEYGHPSEVTYNNLNTYGQEKNYNILNHTLTTYENGNIVFYVNQNQTIKYLTIKNVNDYIYISWKTCVVVITIIFLSIAVYRSIKPNKTKASNI